MENKDLDGERDAVRQRLDDLELKLRNVDEDRKFDTIMMVLSRAVVALEKYSEAMVKTAETIGSIGVRMIAIADEKMKEEK